MPDGAVDAGVLALAGGLLLGDGGGGEADDGEPPLGCVGFLIGEAVSCEGVGLGEGLAVLSDPHDSPLPDDETTAAVALPSDAATIPLTAAVSSAPPVARVSTVFRAGVKRM